MADTDPGLFAIDVGADDYAETAAGDAPSDVPRTFQSEADFQAQKASYRAKCDGPGTMLEFTKAVPALCNASLSETRTKLSKKDFQLLSYAVGELYYDRKYGEMVELCDLVLKKCDLDEKATGSLAKWRDRAHARTLGSGPGSVATA